MMNTNPERHLLNIDSTRTFGAYRNISIIQFKYVSNRFNPCVIDFQKRNIDRLRHQLVRARAILKKARRTNGAQIVLELSRRSQRSRRESQREFKETLQLDARAPGDRGLLEEVLGLFSPNRQPECTHRWEVPKVSLQVQPDRPPVWRLPVPLDILVAGPRLHIDLRPSDNYCLEKRYKTRKSRIAEA